MSSTAYKFDLREFCPEQFLIAACSRDRTGLVDRMTREISNWEPVLELAERHAMLPLVSDMLLDLRAVHRDPELIRRLKHFRKRIAVKNEFLKQELIRILTLFQDLGIEVIPYKGPVLAEELYGDIVQRQFDDLDLFVRREDLDRAESALRRGGYRLLGNLSSQQRSAEIAFRGSLELGHEKHLTEVDLHCSIVEPFYSMKSPINWEKLEERAFGSLMIKTLSPEDLLLVLCVHGSKHHFSKIRWLCDIVQLVEKNPSIKWKEIFASANQNGTSRILGASLLLSNKFLGARVPANIVEELEEIPEANSIALDYCREFFSVGMRGEIDIFKQDLRLRECYSDRIKYVFGRVFLPFDEDWQIVKVPKALFPIYFVLKPLKILAKGLSLLRGSPHRQV